MKCQLNYWIRSLLLIGYTTVLAYIDDVLLSSVTLEEGFDALALEEY